MTYMTEERLMIQETAREFALNEVVPIANEYDPLQKDIPRSLIDKMGELGFFGILIPEEYGGLGLGYFEYCLVAEELSRAWMSVGSIIARGNKMIGADQMNEQQRGRYLTGMASGQCLGSFSMSEPEAGSDVSNISCRAVKVDGGWRITGNKYWCTFADGSDFMIVVVRTAEASPERRYSGLSMFVIDKERGALPEGCKGSPIPKIGYFGWKTYELAFDNCFVPDSGLIGEEGKGFYYTSSGLEGARAHTAARSIGVAQGAYDAACAYVHERKQFGRAIGEFQAIRFKIANMATEIEAARQLMYFVCNEIDSGRRCDKEAAMVKLFASEMSERVTSEAMQILGGAGYTTHYPVERFWRDARLTKIFEGTSEIQLRIISDKILGKSKFN